MDLAGLLHAAAKAGEPTRVWGIDLGTTNSTVAEIVWPPEGGACGLPQCRCLELDQPTREGVYTSPLVPSVVAVLPEGEHWVGEGAKRLRTRPQEAALAVERTLFFGTKNDMGLRKTYYRAAESYNHAYKIAGHVLAFLDEGAEQMTGEEADRVVVTVPASFQLNQRRDTLRAAEHAGLELGDHDLLDEPTAALIDYLFTHPDAELAPPGKATKGLVLDFGGGTCDVTTVEILYGGQPEKVKVRTLAISRYHRLGGGDLDAAIVHEHLIPALFEENGLDRGDLKWSEKKKGLEPQLLGTAEALKIALCGETDRLRKFGRYESASKEAIVSRQPSIVCKLGQRELGLSRPSLSAAQWEKILVPFLDTDLLFARETDYRLTQSIFSPLRDALDRAGLGSEDVDFCLLVGGSTLIPQVQDAIEAYFPGATILAFADALDAQTAVARGAAWHALYLALTGEPLMQPIVGDTIALLIGEDEPYPLIPAGASVPYPPDGSFARRDDLAVPEALALEIRMDVIGLSTRQPLFRETWELRCAVDAGEPITLEYRLRATQEFECRAYLTREPSELFKREIQNPLSNVVSPHRVREQIEEAEEALRLKYGGSAEDRDTFVQIAQWYAELNQHERAINWLDVALQRLNHADGVILNLQGLYLDELGDCERSAKMYREADRATANWGGPMFNLSLSLSRQKRYAEALDAIDSALAKEPGGGPYLTQRALCLRALGREAEGEAELRTALIAFEPPTALSDWALGWLYTCADCLGDGSAKRQVTAEQRRRSKSAAVGTPSFGPRPVRQREIERQEP